MNIYPFSGYLDYFPNSYGETEIERKKLKDFAFPVNPEIMENKSTGLAPIKRDGQDFFNVRELIGYARMFSIPNLGYIAKKPIRAAEILNTEITENKETGEERIITVFVACAYMRPKKQEEHLIFICPFCGCVHYHGSGEKFGDGNGHRQPHCSCQIPAFYRLNFQKYGLQLDPNWQFSLVEMEDFTRAGAFPVQITKHITSRFK